MEKRIFLIGVVLWIIGGLTGCRNSESKTFKNEGKGYSTPEAAAEAYVQGLTDNDINKIISACAVETYVEHFDLETWVEQTNGISLEYGVLPNKDSMSQQINIELRRSEIVSWVRLQYLTLLNSDILGGQNIAFEAGKEDISTFLNRVFYKDGSNPLTKISFSGEYLDPDKLTDGIYSSEGNQNVIIRSFERYHNEDLKSLALLITVDGTKYVLTLETIKYSGKWYILEPDGNLSQILGISPRNAGLVRYDE